MYKVGSRIPHHKPLRVHAQWAIVLLLVLVNCTEAMDETNGVEQQPEISKQLLRRSAAAGQRPLQRRLRPTKRMNPSQKWTISGRQQFHMPAAKLGRRSKPNPYYEPPASSFKPLFIDNYICDMEASILIVTHAEQVYPERTSGVAQTNDAKRVRKRRQNPEQPQEGEYSDYNMQYYDYGGIYDDAAHYGPDPPHSSSQFYDSSEQTKRMFGHKHRIHHQTSQANKQEINRQQQTNNNQTQSSMPPTSFSSEPMNMALAHRLGCSTIARTDVECSACCHMAAKRDRSMPKESIIGFIANVNEFSISGTNNNVRPGEELGTGGPDNLGQAIEPRCVCCSPKQQVIISQQKQPTREADKKKRNHEDSPYYYGREQYPFERDYQEYDSHLQDYEPLYQHRDEYYMDQYRS